MQAFCDELVQQSEEARMNVNGRKTKDMMIGSIAKEPRQLLSLCGAMIDRVTAFKLFMCPVISSKKKVKPDTWYSAT